MLITDTTFTNFVASIYHKNLNPTLASIKVCNLEVMLWFCERRVPVPLWVGRVVDQYCNQLSFSAPMVDKNNSNHYFIISLTVVYDKLKLQCF